MKTLQKSDTPGKQGLFRRLVMPGADAGAAGYPVRVLITAAAIPSVASLVLTVWSLMDSLPEAAPWGVGLAAGGVLDVALVSSVAIAWVAPAVARPAQSAGWAIALLAAGLVGWHSWLIDWPLAALGAIPLAAKALWSLALHARLAQHAAAREEAEQQRAAEVERERQAAEQRAAADAEAARRAAELDTGLTHEQQAKVARRRRDAAYARELSDAELELERAQAQAAHEAELERIRRAAAQQMEMDREDAAVIKQRVQLTREIQAGRGLALGSSEAAPDDLSSLAASPGAALMGFGQAMGSDQGAPRGASPAPAPRARAAQGLEPRLQVLVDYIAEAGEAASVRGAARALGCDAATVRRRRDALAEQGFDVSPLPRKTQ
ncbi:hypothetical protein [Streptomonospora wellingtoniae]|uniref:DUF2637 domain-containing protein n=1 Tax=Streptomonospora wellingtoniae TaxID=3075544 RepID=A0ABU2KUD6_9ACTN|nr:hypothetical protein [Streptomonospora sp. DSM 45055]MDT0302865.1 hypothetical protein [Streptomonospora sp. DSM 45055]